MKNQHKNVLYERPGPSRQNNTLLYAPGYRYLEMQTSKYVTVDEVQKEKPKKRPYFNRSLERPIFKDKDVRKPLKLHFSFADQSKSYQTISYSKIP